jgi:hypothetical protein
MNSEESGPILGRRATLAAMATGLAGTVLIGSSNPATAATLYGRVNTYAELKALPLTTPMEPVLVLGRTAPGDGGAGVFRWDGTAASDDGGTVLTSTSATGVWRRVAEDPDSISPRWFGCVADGETDDTEPFQKAVNVAVRAKKTLRLPTGSIVISSAVTVPTGSASRKLSIIGHGPQESEIRLRSNGRLNFDMGTSGEFTTGHFILRDVSLRCESAATVVALRVAFSRTSGATSQTVIIENVEVTGISDSTGPLVGILLEDASSLRMRGARIQGVRQNIAAGSAGVVLRGSSIPVECYVSECNVYFVATAFFVDGVEGGARLEGIHFDKCAAVACFTGIKGSAKATDLGLWLKVSNCHFNCTQFGIELQNVLNALLTGNLIYGLTGVGPASSFIGIQITNYLQGGGTGQFISVVTDNMLVYPSSSSGLSRNGIVVYGESSPEDSMLISNNTFSNFNTGIWLASGSNRAAVANTNMFRGCTSATVNQGVNNVPGTPLASW